MNSFKYCRCCLVTDVKLYSFKSKLFGEELRELYSRMLQIQDTHEDDHMCFECSALLYKYTMFKDKCSRAHKLLSNYIKREKKMSRKVIESVDRKKSQLQTNMACSEVMTYFNAVVNIVEESIKVETKEIFGEESAVKNEPPSNSDDDSDFKGTPVKKENCIPRKQLIRRARHKPTTINDNVILKKSEVKNKQPRVEKMEFEVPVFQDVNELKEPVDAVASVNCTEKNEEMEDETDIKERKETTDLKKEEDLSSFSLSESEDESIEETKKRPGSKKATSKLNYVKNHVEIVHLNRDDAEKEIQLRKNSNNYINSIFKCEYCFRGFGLKSTFENHIQKHKEVSGPHKCDICHVRYLRIAALNGHMRAAHKMKFICRECPFVSYSLGNIKVHVDFHQGKKYTCKECGDVFSMPNSLASHLRHKHKTERVCEFCGETFFGELGLVMHRTQRHRQEKNEKEGPKCDVCDIHFANETAWKRHLVLSSKHDTVNGCKDCGEIFSDAHNLKIHKNEAHDDKRLRSKKGTFPMTCPLFRCDRVLATYIEYKIHVTADHPRSVYAKIFINSSDKTLTICEVCGDSFEGQFEDYEYHVTNNHPEFENSELIKAKAVFSQMLKTTGSVICEICGESFMSSTLLRYHQRKHTGERPYKCPNCGKCFYTKTNLNIHIETHKNLASFKCDMCTRTFKTKCNLVKHIRTNHLNIRPYKCPHCDLTFSYACHMRKHINHVHCNVPYPKVNRSKRKKKPNL